MIVENICCQGSVLGYEFYFRSKVLGFGVENIIQKICEEEWRKYAVS
jgi:hypothetical protein